MRPINNVTLGSGLIGIGRKWGHKESSIPSENEALRYLDYAYKLGIRFFDTAPAYGSSEERLGKFIKSLPQKKRDEITVATKFGEHWDAEKGLTYTDHSFNALQKSLDQSLQHLGKIDILQIHKTSPKVLHSTDLKKGLTYARSNSITRFGASVSDKESAEIVCDSNLYSSIQLPFNEANTTFAAIIERAQAKGKMVIVNRPFNMGGILYEKVKNLSPEEQRIHAYRFILQRVTTKGVVLTGTKSADHLRENWDAFKKISALMLKV
jgi:aryl-alcohol dehydrogenase-like predicted oxidoreductase